MSSTVPVIAGLAIGIGFILVFSLAPLIIIKEPIMYLTADDGRTYKASINEYCKIQCDFLAYSRVIPEGPTVHINKESDFTLRTSGIEQPSAVRFYIQNYESGTSSGFDVITRDGSTYQIPSALDSGEYLIDILAFWDDNTISIHRFKMNID